MTVPQFNQSYQQYQQHFSGLIQLEREEEMRLYREEITHLSGKERERRGRALLQLRGKTEEQTLAGMHAVRFSRPRPLPETEIAVGDLVMVSTGDPLQKKNPTGTVIEKTKYSISASFSSPPPPLVYGKGLRLDLYVNDVTFQRMLGALTTLGTAPTRQEHWRHLLLGSQTPRIDEDRHLEHEPLQPLNDSQRGAVSASLQAQDVFLVHGPPGTGKTTTLAEVVRQHALANQRVLATAASNIAVDNMVELLAAAGLAVVRVGHPARVTPHLREHTLDGLTAETALYRQAALLREEVEHLNKRQARHSFPKQRWRRGMSNKTIKRLARERKSSRGVSARKLHSMARWIKYQDHIRQLLAKANRLENEAIDRVLGRAEVVCTTNATAGSEILAEQSFDVVVIDEATQATEPSCLIPLVKAGKLIMAGDHRQLPPTVQSQRAEEGGLVTSMFERLLSTYGPAVQAMLTVQYRMSREIMRFSNQRFYEGRLQAAPQVAEHRLQQGADLADNIVLDPEKPLIFIDTNGNAPEHTRRGSTSKENEEEAALIAHIATRLLQLGVQASALGVISPYDDQVDLLRRCLGPDGLEIKTVDGFQGREKDVILVSLVRANPRGEIGFLADLRRLNVSVTRARKKLVLVGEARTLSHDATYQKLIDVARELGGYIQCPPGKPCNLLFPGKEN